MVPLARRQPSPKTALLKETAPAKSMKKITVPEQGTLALFGTQDENLKSIENALKVKIVTRGHELQVEGDARQV